MARAKRHKQKKRLKQRRASFYEAMPLGLSAPVPSLELKAQLDRAVSNVVKDGQHAINWILRQWTWLLQQWAWIRPQLHAMTTSAVAVAGPALNAGWDTTRHYSQALGADIITTSRRLGRTATSRRARASYVAVLATGAMAATLVSVSLATSTMASYGRDISSPAAIMNKKKTGTTILDRNGVVLYDSYGARTTTVTPLDKIPQPIKDATLVAEDPGFYDHAGFSVRGTVRAAWVDLTQGATAEGGSTLTQQLVKNSLLTTEKTFERKYKEIVLAMELERRYSKDQILEMYLNKTDYGQGSQGVSMAAQTYFHKPLNELSLGQMAMIAGLPLGTNRFDPNAHPAAAKNRRDQVLDRMAELGKITNDQAKAAKAETITSYVRVDQIRAPHFVFYVLDQLRQQYGEQFLETGGLTVHTTLDLGKQEAGERIVKEQVERLSGHNASNGGLVSIEPATGDIISMVGSIGYETPGFGAVNVTLSELQPGSSFKPITYATAFTKGWNGSTQVDDTPMQLPNGDGSLYIPQNYDGKFRGKVTLRRALANSLNIPALKVLQFAGIDETIDMAHKLGVTGLNDRNRYGLSLVLGGGEVRPIDMATVYATFANNGTKVTPRAILKVEDRYGKDITKKTQPASQQALDPRFAYMITSILSDNAARTEEFGANSPLKLDRPAAAKTGTTNDFRDNWTVGYTPNLATAVWVGNNDHSAMNNVDGITGAAPIWHDYMEMAHVGIPEHQFVAPAGVTSTKACSADGGLANPWDTTTYDEIFLTDQPLTRKCNSFSNFFTFKPSTSPTPTTEPTPIDEIDQKIKDKIRPIFN